MEILAAPAWLQLDITHKCNLACAMCPRNMLSLGSDEMALDVFGKIVDRVSHLKLEMVSLTGMGEPLMHPHLFEMIRLLVNKQVAVSTTTNGILLDQTRIEKLIDNRLDYIRFSVDQVRNIHKGNAIHAYSPKALDNIKTFMEIKNARHSDIPKANLITVVTPYNFRHIREIIDWAKQTGLEYVQLMKLSNRINQLKRLPAFIEKLYFKKYHRYAEKIGAKVRSTYENRTESFCAFLKNYLFFLPNGDVTPCCHLRHYIVGNIFKETVAHIWNGKKMNCFRRDWVRICGGCNLMMWDFRKAKPVALEDARANR
jgi:MoaA/NifB/PqqE/SkfB family radical SAM enzyme